MVSGAQGRLSSRIAVVRWVRLMTTHIFALAVFGCTFSCRDGQANCGASSEVRWVLEIVAPGPLGAPKSLCRRRWAPRKHCAGALGARNCSAGAAGRSEIAAPAPPGAPNSLRSRSRGSGPWLGPACSLESKTPQPLHPLRPGASKAPQPLQPLQAGASKTLRPQ